MTEVREYNITWMAEAQFSVRLALTQKQIKRIKTTIGKRNLLLSGYKKDKSLIDWLMKMAEYDTAFSPYIEEIEINSVD